MNSRVLTGIAGTIILALGLAGLLYPFTVMANLGLAQPNQTVEPFVLGEIRATFGGVFVVMGAYALSAIVDPSAHRSRLTFIALMWIGAALGRLFGTTVDGSPGVFGWLSVAFEALLGSMLLVAAWMPSGSTTAAAVTPSAPPPPPAPIQSPPIDERSV